MSPGKPIESPTNILIYRREGCMGRAVGFMDDLFFQMKIAETAKHVGVEFKVASTSEALMRMLDAPTKLVILDLNAKNQPLATLASLRAAQKDLRVVAFLSHVQTDLAAQARAAGCSEVMPRSAFTQNLAAILQLAKD
jgi:DNA-binding NarL/FixJ family response regulator